MKTKTNEIIIGISVSLATLIVILGILWLGRSNFFTEGLHLNLIVNDAQGLNIGDEVYFRGLSVGSVQSADLDSQGVVLQLKLDKTVMIPIDSRFILKEQNLLGDKVIQILPGTSGTYLKTGDSVRGEHTGSLMSTLRNSKSLRERIDKILVNIDSLTGTQSTQMIHTSLTALNKTLQDAQILLEQNQKDLSSLIKNLDTISSENKEPLHKIINDLSQKSDELSEAIVRTKSAVGHMDDILGNIENGKGSMGKFFTNDSLYNNMNRSFAQLDSLLQDIRKNPKKYFEVKVF